MAAAWASAWTLKGNGGAAAARCSRPRCLRFSLARERCVGLANVLLPTTSVCKPTIRSSKEVEGRMKANAHFLGLTALAHG